MSKKKHNRRDCIRYINETLDLALAHPRHGTGIKGLEDDLVADAAGKMIGDDCIPYDRFLGWRPDAVRTVLTTYAALAPDADCEEMVRRARDARQFLYVFALEGEYESTGKSSASGKEFEAWCKRQTPAPVMFRRWLATERRAA